MSSNSVTLDLLRCSSKVGHSSTSTSDNYMPEHLGCALVPSRAPQDDRARTLTQAPQHVCPLSAHLFVDHPTAFLDTPEYRHVGTHTHQESPTSRTFARGTTGRRSSSLAPRITPPPLTPGPLAVSSRSSCWARCVLALCARTRHAHAHALTHPIARSRSRMHACSCARIVCMVHAHV